MATPGCIQRRDVTPPQIFISSTLDSHLVEIRDALKSEMSGGGLLPVMSELGTFSYTHGRACVTDDTVGAVSGSQHYVLVVGRRYGTVDGQTNTSVTEREYEAARAAGLPMLVYVHAPVWEGYKAFKAKAIADGRHTLWVDDLRVFSFLDRVATVHGTRCVPFQLAREITDDFRHQLANMLGGFLRFERRARSWLWTEEYTREIELGARVIWILTPNFYWDYLDAEFRSIVGDNVTQRGTRYFYLYRDSEENRGRIDDMTSDYTAAMGSDAWRDIVRYAPIPPEEFNWCTEHAMYDPGDPGRERGVIVDIMDGRDKANKCNIELGREKRLALRAQFTRLWLRYGIGDLAGALSPDTPVPESG
jgi:uncharacterized protein DUF4062